MTGLPTVRSGAALDQFLEQLKGPAPRVSIGYARLIFGLDATASRESTWDQACGLTPTSKRSESPV